MELYRTYCEYDGTLHVHGPYKICNESRGYLHGVMDTGRIRVPKAWLGKPRHFLRSPHGSALVADFFCADRAEARSLAREAFYGLFCRVNISMAPEDENREGIYHCSCNIYGDVSMEGPFDLIRESQELVICRMEGRTSKLHARKTDFEEARLVGLGIDPRLVVNTKGTKREAGLKAVRLFEDYFEETREKLKEGDGC